MIRLPSDMEWGGVRSHTETASRTTTLYLVYFISSTTSVHTSFVHNYYSREGTMRFLSQSVVRSVVGEDFVVERKIKCWKMLRGTSIISVCKVLTKKYWNYFSITPSLLAVITRLMHLPLNISKLKRYRPRDPRVSFASSISGFKVSIFVLKSICW